jgi:beta-N-acetylhexosaminidase
MEKHLGQLILTGIPGTSLDQETARLIKTINPGGFILFGRNIQSATQLRQLIDDLRAASTTEPIITIDQEGGRVSRLRLIGNEPPSAQQLRDKGSIELISRHGELTGKLLRLFGFNLDLCPVLDFSPDDDADNSLKGRCYGSTVTEVIENASAFNTNLRKEGILSCGKHFPGYTYALCDAHEELPVVDRTRSEWLENEAAPFQSLLPELDSIMVCHTHYPFMDPDRPRWPASLSHNVINGVLRKELGFKNGLVITDDLDMGAILKEVSFEETITTAIHAGNDMVMICHRMEMVQQAYKTLETLTHSVATPALERIAAAKKRLCKPSPFSIEEFDALDSMVWDLRVDTLGEEEAAKRSPEDGKRSPVETY